MRQVSWSKMRQIFAPFGESLFAIFLMAAAQAIVALQGTCAARLTTSKALMLTTYNK
jgi:hypothetical protein